MSEELEVIKDPNSEGSMGDIEKQTALMTKIKKASDECTEMINTMERLRRQLLDMHSMLKDGKKEKALVKAVDSLEREVEELEGELIQLKYTGTGQDGVRYPTKIASKLSYLATTVPSGDFAPADSYYDVFDMLTEQMKAVEEKFETLKAGQMKTVMDQLKNKDVGPIIIGGGR